MKESIYLETTGVSYYTSKPSRDIIVLAHQEITREWRHKAIRRFDVFISELVVEETGLGDPEATKRRLEEIKDFPFEQIKGIIIVPDTGEDLVAGRVMAWLKYELVPSGKGIENCKVVLSDNCAVFYFRREAKSYTDKIDFA
jgi:hypothetical protein